MVEQESNNFKNLFFQDDLKAKKAKETESNIPEEKKSKSESKSNESRKYEDNQKLMEEIIRKAKMNEFLENKKKEDEQRIKDGVEIPIKPTKEKKDIIPKKSLINVAKQITSFLKSFNNFMSVFAYAIKNFTKSIIKKSKSSKIPKENKQTENKVEKEKISVHEPDIVEFISHLPNDDYERINKTVEGNKIKKNKETFNKIMQLRKRIKRQINIFVEYNRLLKNTNIKKELSKEFVNKDSKKRNKVLEYMRGLKKSKAS